MGIKIINSFELNSPLPLDARAVANNINEMNELITKNFVVAGQMCYNKADNKLYVLKKNSEGALLSWHEVADSVDLDNINKVLPTDIAIKDNKLGLEHDNVWLTNQNAINLGDNMTYDATTKTLNAKGGGGSSYTPLEINVSSTNDPIDLTKEQYDILFNAISNNEPIIAYIVVHRDTILGKIPLTSPMYDGQVENVKLFYGAYFTVSAMDNKYYTYLWYLAKIGEEQDASYLLQCSSSLSLLKSNGGLLFSSDNKKLQFSLSSQEKDFIGSAVTFDSINGNPVIHNEFTTSRNYTIPTITFED